MMVAKSTKKKTEIKTTKPTKNVTWPMVEKGSHLTVYTHEDGKTTLEWDDEALLRDVRNAILKAESTVPVTTKPAVKAKSIRNRKAKV